MPRDPLIVGRIPPALDEQVRDYAGQHGITISAALRAALTTLVAQPGPPPHPTPTRASAARTHSPATCTHRVRPGNYCRRCQTIVT